MQLALQDIALLEEKRKLKSHQLEFAKQTSTVTQPCNTGDLHHRERHHAETLTLHDVPTLSLISPLAEELQQLRDTGKLNVPAKIIELIMNVAICLPTVLLKSCDTKRKATCRPTSSPASLTKASRDQYKKEMTIELRNKVLSKILQLLTEMRGKGRIIREEFEKRNHPIDIDSDGIEHLLSRVFATQNTLSEMHNFDKS